MNGTIYRGEASARRDDANTIDELAQQACKAAISRAIMAVDRARGPGQDPRPPFSEVVVRVELRYGDTSAIERIEGVRP